MLFYIYWAFPHLYRIKKSVRQQQKGQFSVLSTVFIMDKGFAYY